jgi:cobaltochelatase CobS
MAFQARQQYTCADCAQTIQIGEKYTWTRTGERKYFHLACAPSAVTTSAEKPDTLAATLADALAAYMPQQTTAVDLPAIEALIDARVNELAANFVHSISVTHTAGAPAVSIANAHKTMPKLLKHVAARRHVYMVGGPGTGKSTAAHQVSEALGFCDHAAGRCTFAFKSLTIQSSTAEVFGYRNMVNGEYVETDFFRAYVNGGVFCFDEIDNASGNLQAALNTALENGHASFPHGMFKRHADFVLVAAGNTNGMGGSAAFPDRRPMDTAFRDRFAFLDWDYDTKMERGVARGINPENGDIWADWIFAVRAYCAKEYPRLVCSPRATFGGASMLLDGFTAGECAHARVFKGLDADSVTRILAAVPLPTITETVAA